MEATRTATATAARGPWRATGSAAAMRPVRLTVLVLLLALASPGAAPAAPLADDPGRWTLIEENDGMISHQDRHYTQGLQIDWLSPALAGGDFGDRTFDALGWLLPMYRKTAASTRRFDVTVIGQQIFTPSETHRDPPDPNDRPYAGWLYSGLGWLQENEGWSLHELELQAGIVGPAALAKQAQNGYHTIVGFRAATGWDYQLKNRGAVQLAYRWRGRVPMRFHDGYAVDFVPQLGVNLGSVMRYASGGGLLRFGNALDADYGPATMHPSLGGSDWFDPRVLGPSHFHWYLFAGGQVRNVWYNRLLDGSAERYPSGVDSRDFVFDAVAGATLVFGQRLHASFTGTRRSPEYGGQQGYDIFGSALISYAF